MNTEDSVLWEYEPHTQAKHDILTYYLKAWFPVQATRPQRLLYIDGFAGPGEYAKGELGSPFLVLDLVLNHALRERITRHGMELAFIFYRG